CGKKIVQFGNRLWLPLPAIYAAMASAGNELTRFRPRQSLYKTPLVFSDLWQFSGPSILLDLPYGFANHHIDFPSTLGVSMYTSPFSSSPKLNIGRLRSLIGRLATTRFFASS